MGNLQNQSIANKYLERFGFREKIIQKKSSKKLGIIIVIPAYNEDLIDKTIHALQGCKLPACEVEIILVLNASENDELVLKSKNLIQFEEIEKSDYKIPVYAILENELPKKHAGVGLARKIGMDEAARRFSEVDVNGVIACFF